jgi:hypothetical protein
MHELLNDAAARAICYLNELEARRVAAAPEALAALKVRGVPLPEEPTDPTAVLSLLDDDGEQYIVLKSRRYLVDGVVNNGG